MKKICFVKVCVVAALLTVPPFVSAQQCLGWSTGYFAQYYGGSYSTIFWNAYTHLCHFSLFPSSSGGLSNDISAAQAQAFVAACHQHNKKALICIGGAGASPGFSGACASASTRATLVRNIVNFMKTNGYDGVDMDWECGEESDNAAMVAKFQQLHGELRDSLNKISPRPMMTAAVADWYPNSCASIRDYCDQMNGMSYYGLVNTMDVFFATLTSRGVPKSKLGIGFGYDTDNEVDVNNPNDIGAKCLYAISNGYGGVMVWLIQRACARCNDTTAHFVTGCQAPVFPASNPPVRYRQDVPLYIIHDGTTGASRIYYMVPSVNNNDGSFVDLGLYDVRGTLIKSLVHEYRRPGAHTVLIQQNNNSGKSIKAGTYIIRFSTNAGTETTRAVIIK